MFESEQLNVIPHLLVGHEWSKAVQKKLNLDFMNLEATLLRGKVLREFSKTKITYMAQSHIHAKTSHLAYLFAPFIFSILNKTILFTTPATATVLNILNKYYLAEQVPQRLVEGALGALKMHIELSDPIEDGKDFFYANLIKALCRTDISTLYLMTEYEVDRDKLNVLSEFLKVEIFVNSTLEWQPIIDSQMVDMRQLLCKSKDEVHTHLCTLFSQKNAELLTQSDSFFSVLQTTNLIEDMFYAEHIYEKLSVYAEYIQTHIQNAQSTQKILLS